MKKMNQLNSLFGLLVALFTAGSLQAAEVKYNINPTTPTKIVLPINGSVLVQYKVENNTSVGTNMLVLTPRPNTAGFTQVTTGPGVCSKPFFLGAKDANGVKQSCLLTFLINGNALTGNLIGGPSVCGNGGSPFYCSQPETPAGVLNITKSNITSRTFITNTGADNVQQCIGTSCTTKTLTNLKTPHGVALNSSYTRIYFSGNNPNPNNGAGAVFSCFINTSGEIGSCLRFESNINGKAPSGVALNPANNFLYVTNSTSGSISVCTFNAGTVDACTNYPLSLNTPNGIVINRANTKAYITETGSNSVKVCNISAANGSLSNCNLAGGGPFSGPFGIVLNATNTMAYVTNSTSGTVSSCPINGATGLFGACTLSNDNFNTPKGITLSLSGLSAYIVDSILSKLFTCPIDPADGTIMTDSCTSLAGFNAPEGVVVFG